jgi:GDP-L-fucose synthase
MAEASLHVMELERAVYDAHTTPTSSHINVGTGEEVTIRELAELLSRVTGYQGSVEFDAEKPDGTPRKLISSDRLSELGWRRKIELEKGLAVTYSHYVNSLKRADLPC